MRLAPLQIVLVGPHCDTATFAKATFATSLPTRILMRIENTSTLPETHPAHGKEQKDGRATAYICRGETCSLPITDESAFTAALLEARSAPL
jgi:uncharacterized protein YyaL (SSP411 family)